MRKVVPELFDAVDGVVERPDSGPFPTRSRGEEMNQVIGRQLLRLTMVGG